MPEKVKEIQRATIDSGDRDRGFRDRDRRFRKTGRNRSRSNEIAGHVRPKQAVTIERNGWSRWAEIRTRAWVEAQLEEFRLYWGDTGERRKSWDATFINRLQALQSRQPKNPPDEPEQRLADKDYAAGATPPEQIPWLKRTLEG